MLKKTMKRLHNLTKTSTVVLTDRPAESDRID